MENTVICLQCPLACRISVTQEENGSIISVTGNTCPRGDKYARQEVVNPVRVLTTTVKINSSDSEHPLLPVMTNGPIPKTMLMDAMKALAQVSVNPPIRYGQVIVKNLLETGVDVCATVSVEQ